MIRGGNTKKSAARLEAKAETAAVEEALMRRVASLDLQKTKPSIIERKILEEFGVVLTSKAIQSWRRRNLTYKRIRQELADRSELKREMSDGERADHIRWLNDKNNKKVVLAQILRSEVANHKDKIAAVTVLHRIEEDERRGDLERFKVRIDYEIKRLVENGFTYEEAIRALEEDIKCFAPEILEQLLLATAHG